MSKIVIAIDGHSSCGKSTVAKEIAKRLNYIYIDTGAMYRAITLFAIRNQLINNDVVNKEQLINSLNDITISFKQKPETGINEICLNGEVVEDKIRGIEVSEAVSHISVIKEVRKKLVEQQQQMGVQKGIVMDGRDIGTVVFPNAELKIFMTASSDVRAMRRYKELTEKGDNVSFEEIKANVEKRDHIDQNRKESPLKKADDALLLDNSEMSREEQLQWVVNKVNTNG